MDAIIPLMPEHPALLSSDAGAAALNRLFASLHDATTLDRILAVGHNSSLLALAQNAGITSVLLAMPHPIYTEGILPTGGAEALDRLSEEDSRTLLISCTNPLLTGQVIDDFVRQAEKLQQPITSVISPLDHPCQLSQHLRMREAGVLLPLDPLRSDRKRLLTKPFRFLWMVQQTRGQGPLFVLHCAQGEPLFLSVPDEAALPAQGPLIIREGLDSARLSLPVHEVLELALCFGVRSLDDIAAVGLHLAPGLSALSFRNASHTLYLGFAAKRKGGRVCQVYAQGGRDGQYAELRASLELTGEPPRAILPWSLDNAATPISYNLLDHLDNDGGFDMTQAFPEVGHRLWRVDPDTGCCLNCVTGRPIHGRQEFPEVLEPDGSLSALTRAEATRFDGLLQAGKVAAFLLEQGRSLQLRTPFDLLRYKAKLRMEEA